MDFHVTTLQIGDKDTEDNQAQIILTSEWLDDQINLFLITFPEFSSHKATVLHTDLLQLAEDYEIEAKEFLRVTKEILTTNSGLEGFKYEITDDQHFTWKRKSATVLFTYGKVRLEPAVGANGLVDILTKLQDGNKTLTEENQKLKEENKNLLMCHTELMTAQKNTETDLLSKCRMLINEKKSKIRELEEKLEKTVKQPVASSDQEKLSEEEEAEADTPIGVLLPGRKRNTTNVILSESSQPDSSEDCVPLAFLPKRQDLANKPRVSLKVENDTQDEVPPPNNQDTPNFNELFGEL